MSSPAEDVRERLESQLDAYRRLFVVRRDERPDVPAVYARSTVRLAMRQEGIEKLDGSLGPTGAGAGGFAGGGAVEAPGEQGVEADEVAPPPFALFVLANPGALANTGAGEAHDAKPTASISYDPGAWGPSVVDFQAEYARDVARRRGLDTGEGKGDQTVCSSSRL